MLSTTTSSDPHLVEIAKLQTSTERGLQNNFLVRKGLGIHYNEIKKPQIT